ncbi:doublesex- and mab-3-related transcription factor B1-like [Astyanax mexicanus]|uniref:Doublesex- and mab-3-related transcription factor B1-like n=1 Tax=Astyanax mexicanus TaxID=7994 RepID=A0A8T2LS12_ASTMX|nr:doublesex- and mab-3-related transcription factor B1-like [Astyanax mexicanus]
MNTGKASRSPKCSRCRNHGFTADRKGHSGKCAFLECTCWKCSLITERTRIMANQRRIRRTAPAHSAAAAAPVTGHAVPAPTGAERPARTATDTEPARRPAEPAAYRSSAGVYDPATYFTPDAPQQIPYSYKMVTMPLLLSYQHPGGFVYPAFFVSLQQPPPGEAIGFPPPPPNGFTYPAEPRQPQWCFNVARDEMPMLDIDISNKEQPTQRKPPPIAIEHPYKAADVKNQLCDWLKIQPEPCHSLLPRIYKTNLFNLHLLSLVKMFKPFPSAENLTVPELNS